MRISYIEHFLLFPNLNQSASISFPSEGMDVNSVSSPYDTRRFRLCFLVKLYTEKPNQLPRAMNRLQSCEVTFKDNSLFVFSDLSIEVSIQEVAKLNYFLKSVKNV